MVVDVIEENQMARRFQRSYTRFPVDLVSFGTPGGFQAPASVMDMSQGGLRVHTGLPLIPGRLIHVFQVGGKRPFAFCRVVWAQTHGGALPSEAGLEILERMSNLPGTHLNLPRVRGQSTMAW
jgi:PilZ domain